jgi:hypothetical protein
MNQLRLLVIFIVAIAALSYLGGIVLAWRASIAVDDVPHIPEIITHAITVIGGVLGTHFGAIFGISQLGSGGGQPVAPLRVYRPSSGSEATISPSTEPLDKLQVFSAYFYVFALFLGLMFWGWDGFSDNSAEILKNISYSLFRVIVGVLTVALNIGE